MIKADWLDLVDVYIAVGDQGEPEIQLQSLLSVS